MSVNFVVVFLRVLLMCLPGKYQLSLERLFLNSESEGKIMSDYVYGIHPVREGLRGRRQPLELFVDERGSNPRVDEVVSLAKERGVPIRQRKRQDLDRLAGLPHHQGVVLSMEPFPYADFADLLEKWQGSGGDAFFLLLDPYDR